MPVTDLLAGAVVGLTAGYLLLFGILATFVPARAARYLLGFARSWRMHVLELTIRLVAGMAFVWNAHRMMYSGVFHAFGWILIVTTLGLAVLPWRWHQRFAERSVPRALRFLRPMGLAAASAGIAVAWALVTP